MARAFVAAESDHIEVDSAPLTTRPMSMACWFLPDNFTNSGVVMSIPNKDTTDDRWNIVIKATTGVLRFRSAWGTAVNTDAGNALTEGVWNHCCVMSASKTDHTTVANGDWANRGTNATDDGTNETADRISIGRSGDSTPAQYAEGKIAECAVWSVVLTQAEVEALADGYSPMLIRPDSLVFYPSLVREISDVVGGLALSDVNGTTVFEHPPMIYPRRRAISYPVTAALILKALTATSAVTAALVTSFIKVIALTVVSTVTVVLAKVATFFRTLLVTSPGVAVLVTSFIKVITMAVVSTVTGALVTVMTAFRTLTVTSPVVAVLAANKFILKAIAATSSVVAVLATVFTKSITMAVTSIVTSVLATVATFLRTLAVTSPVSVVLSSIATFARTLAVVSTEIVTLAASFIKVLSLTVTTSPTVILTQVQLILQALVATSAGVAMLSTVKIKVIALTVVSTVTVVLARVATFFKALAVTSPGVAVLATVATFFRSLSVISTVVVSLTSQLLAGILDEIIEGAITLRVALRIILGSMAGKLSGAGTTRVKIRDTNDAVDRIDATVDESGNRLSVTLDTTGTTGGGPDPMDEFIEGTITFRETMRIILGASAGKLSGAGTTRVKIRDTNDTKNRIDAVVDEEGNRITVTLDKS